MTVLFHHGFKVGLGPFVTRYPDGQDVPSSPDCAEVVRNYAVLRIRDNPLRTGHIWVPPEEFTVTHGLVEARMRFRGSKGVHNAFWTQPVVPYASSEHYEIDIVEHFGGEGVQHGIWYRPDTYPAPEFQKYHGAWSVDARDWHVYACDIRAESITWLIDGTVVGSVSYGNKYPQTLILSMLADQWERKWLDMATLSDHKFQIDWVKVTA